MRKEIFASQRYFKLSDIVVSHGQLLLRSQKDEKNSNNIDIIFFSTTFMQIISELEGVQISLMTDESKIEYPSVKKYLSYTSNHLFEIQSNDEHYYVVAAFVRVFENRLNFNETSLNFDNIGRENEIASSI